LRLEGFSLLRFERRGRKRHHRAAKPTAAIVLLFVAAALSVATSFKKSKKEKLTKGSVKLTITNPYPLPVTCRLAGPVRKQIELAPHSKKTLELPAGEYLLSWRRPSLMTRYKVYRKLELPGGATAVWKVGLE
jgi:hypothetical protein